jgi:hypothetical protein
MTPPTTPDTKILVVVNATSDDRWTIARYMPLAYNVVWVDDDGVWIEGHDVFGWTAEDYVIPRLATGLWFAERRDMLPAAASR